MTDIEPDRVIEARGLTKLYGDHRAILPAQMRGAILGRRRRSTRACS